MTEPIPTLNCTHCTNATDFALIVNVEAPIRDHHVHVPSMPEAEWSDDSIIRCLRCQHRGALRSFYHLNLDQLARTHGTLVRPDGSIRSWPGSKLRGKQPRFTVTDLQDAVEGEFAEGYRVQTATGQFVALVSADGRLRRMVINDKVYSVMGPMRDGEPPLGPVLFVPSEMYE